MRTVRDCVEQWLATRKAVLRETTWLDYREKAERYVLRDLGGTAAAAVERSDLEAHYSRLACSGYSGRTVRYAHAILLSAFDHAVRTRCLSRNPVREVTIPWAPGRGRCCLGPAEVARFLLVAASDRLAALWYLLASAALYPGEAVALRWNRVDLKDGIVRVDTTLRAMGRGRWAAFALPTDRCRQVRLTPMTVSVLISHHERQRAEWNAAELSWNEAGLVLTEPNGAPVVWRRAANGPFKALLAKAGLPPVAASSLRRSAK